MNTNVGKYDRLARIIGGTVILAIGLYFKSYWGLIGFVPLFTGLVRWCPLYVPFKITTFTASDEKAGCCH